MPPKRRTTNSEAGLRTKLGMLMPPKRKKKPPQPMERNVLPPKPKRRKNYLNPNLKRSKSPMMNGKLNRRRKINPSSTSENLAKVKTVIDGVA